MNENLDSKNSNSVINHLNITVINTGISELKTIKLQKLKSVCQPLKDSSYRINSNLIPSHGGVYCFWWTGNKEYFINTINRKLDLAGPGGRRVIIEITNFWLKSQRDHFCSLDIFKEKPKTTSVQLKRGLEELFINEPDIRNLILENV